MGKTQQTLTTGLHGVSRTHFNFGQCSLMAWLVFNLLEFGAGVHGSGYTHTVAKNATDGSPQAFSIGTVLGGNPREKTGGSNPTAGKIVTATRIVL